MDYNGPTITEEFDNEYFEDYFYTRNIIYLCR